LLFLAPACSDPPQHDGENDQPEQNCEISETQLVEQVCGQSECAHLVVCQDTTAPQITLTSAAATESEDYTLQGEIAHDGDLASASYSLDGGAEQELEVQDGAFEASLTLSEGDSPIEIIAVDESGNEGKLQATIRFELPARELHANFTVSGTFETGEVIHVDATSTVLPREASAEYIWDFGDGATGRGEATNHVYGEPGVYVVSLQVVTDTGEESVHLDNVEIGGRQATATYGVLDGLVVDPAGEPVEGATVEVGELHLQSMSSATGQFGFDELPVNTALALSISHPDYVERVVRIDLPGDRAERFLRVQLSAPAAPQTGDDATAATSVSGADGSSAQIEGGSLTDENGDPISGSFEVVVTPLDVVSYPNQLPGGSTAVLSDGSLAELKSAGAVHVAFYQDGEPLQVAPGRMVTVKVPMYVPLAQAGETLPSFELNAASGLWLEQPSATVETAADAPPSTVATIEIARAGWWLVGTEVAPDVTISARCTQPATNDGTASGADAGSGTDASSATDAGLGTDTGIQEEPELCWFEAQSNGWTHYFGADVDEVYDFDAPEGEVCLTALARGGLCRGEACVTGVAGDSLAVDVELDCLDEGAQPIAHDETIDDVALDDTAPRAVFGFDGDAGEGIIFQMRQDHPEPLAGKLQLYAATGSLVTSVEVAQGEDEALAAVLPDTGRYLAVVEVENAASGTVSTRLVRREVLGVGDRGTGTLNYGQGAVYLVDAGNETLLNGLLTGDLGSGSGFTRFHWLDLLGNNENSGPVTLSRETGLHDVSGRRFHQLRLYRRSYPYSNPTDFEVTVSASTTPQSMNFDSLGRALVTSTLREYGEHRFMEFDANQGDGIYLELRGSGDDPSVSAQKLGIRVWYKGTGTFWNGEEQLYELNRDPGVIDAWEAYQFRAEQTGTYVVEIYTYASRGRGVDLGQFEVSIDKAAGSADITVGGSNCVQADTRSVGAAMRAIQSNGTITLCEGTYSSLRTGLIDRDGVTLTGAGPDQSFLRYTHQIYRDDGRVVLTLDGADITVENLGIVYHLPAELRGGGRHHISDRYRNSPGSGTSTGAKISNVHLIVDTVQRGVGAGISLVGQGGYGTSGVDISDVTIEGTNTGIFLRGDDMSVTDSTLTTNGKALRVDGRDVGTISATVVENCTVDAGGNGLDFDNSINVRVANNTLTTHGLPISVHLDRPGASTTQVVSNTMSSSDALSTIQISQQDQPDSDARRVEIHDNTLGSHGRRPYNGLIKIRAYDGSTTYDIRRNLIDTAGGTGIDVWASGRAGGTLDIVNNVIEETWERDPGINIDGTDRFSSISVINNSVRAQAHATWWEAHRGLRLGFDNSSVTGTLPVTVRNNIFRAPEDNAQHVGIQIGTSSAVTIDSDYNLFFKYPSAYAGGQQTAGANDITGQDPLFTDSQLHLDPTSPAVDAGTCTSAPASDLAGISRPQGASCDIGAYE
jgi:hypothetical protein